MYPKSLNYTLFIAVFLLVSIRIVAQQDDFSNRQIYSQVNPTNEKEIEKRHINNSPRMLYCATTPETTIEASDGIITLQVADGNAACGNYTYIWSSTNGFEANITDKPTGNTLINLKSGLYRVIVTDCEGTTMLDSIYVNRINRNSGKKGGARVRDFNKNSLFECLPSFFTQ
ncbi:MAG: hypothetical protein ACPGVB_03845 [Chitinophagales bacterium]